MKNRLVHSLLSAMGVAILVTGPPCLAAPPPTKPDCESMRLAIVDLIETFGDKYPRGRDYLKRLDAIEAAAKTKNPSAVKKLAMLRWEALLANPLLDFDELILLKRRRGQWGLPTNHQCNSCLKQNGYDGFLSFELGGLYTSDPLKALREAAQRLREVINDVN